MIYQIKQAIKINITFDIRKIERKLLFVNHKFDFYCFDN